MLQVQTRKPARTFNRAANIRTDKPTTNSMRTRGLYAWTQPLRSVGGQLHRYVTAISHIAGGVVTNITITDAGFGYTNAPTICIAPPPAAAVLPSTVLPMMRVASASLAPYHNYQIQCKPDTHRTWANWNGGLFSPTDVTNSQCLFITNGVGFFRLQYLP